LHSEGRKVGLDNFTCLEVGLDNFMYEGWNFNSGNYLFTTATK